jgi:predicted nucleotidyltransferase
VSDHAPTEDRVDQEAVAAVLREAVEAVEQAEIPYVLIGGLASAVLGRPRWTADVDFLVRRDDAKRVLEALEPAGFETEETNPEWIYKAERDDVTIDVIFWLKGDIYLDDEMLARSRLLELDGVVVNVVPPEDLVVIKAAVHDEQTPRHWHDALGVIADNELDWDYLARRARHSARRVLALLVYAQSNDLVVTDDVVRSLFESVYG